MKNVLEKKYNHILNFIEYLSYNIFNDDGKYYDKYFKFSETKTLGKISEIQMGFTPSTKKSDFWEGNNKWLSIADLKSKYIFETTKHISDDATKNKKIIPKDTLIMSFKLTLGKLGILKEDMYTNEAICNFTWLIPMQTEYMYYYLNSLNIKKYGAIAAKGITLNKDLLNSIPIKTISMDLQTEIMNIFKYLDYKLDILEKEIELNKEFKRSLLSKMFC